jgi:hypothetical protein
MDMTQVINALLPMIQNIVAGVMQVSGSGMIGTARELKAVSDYADEAAKKFAGNPVIEALIEPLQGNFLENVNIEALDVNNVLSSVMQIDSLLPPELTGEVKQFLYELAQRVASASGQGFFGSGEKVTEVESQYLDALRVYLGLSG